MLIQAYNLLKNLFSVIIDGVYGGVPRRPVPVFSGPMAANTYLQINCKYTGDPGKGIIDYSTNPEVLQAAMEAGAKGNKDAAFANMHIDCDDYAAWAYAACHKIPGCLGNIYTLLDSGLVGSHVIFVGFYKGGYFAIDTNGYRVLPDNTETTICRVWSTIYAGNGYKYIQAVITPFPFPVPV